MVKDLLKYYASVALKFKRYTIPPLFIAPFGRIGGQYIVPLITADIINKVSSPDRPAISSLKWQLIAVLAVPLVADMLWRVVIYLMNRGDANSMEQIGNDTFNNLTHRSFDFHSNHFSGSLVAKMGRFVSAYEPLYDTLVFDIMGTLVSIVFALVILMKISWIVGAIVIAIMIIYVIIAYRLNRKRYKMNVVRAEADSRVTAQLADALTNAINIKIFAREDYELKLFKKRTNDFRNKRVRSWDYANFPIDTVTNTLVTALNAIAILGSVIIVYRSSAPVGDIFLVVTYMMALTSRFWDFSKIIRTIETNLSNGVEMMQILKEPSTVIDRDGALDLRTTKGQIDFQDVSFTYEKSKKSDLFDGLNISIQPGESIGLVGPSGGGKTTITKLLLRFMDLRQGSIKIDGHDISEINQKSLRNLITYVPQEPLLFHRSLAENIAYGRPGASMKKIIEAAKKAHAHEFIESLPNGYDTLVGERGIKLSGGQRQRVALARAILKDAPIIVLDEATSALDSESEKLIQDALFRLIAGRTTIIIAHRLSTIKHLDRILVLDKGRVVEEGSHQELIKNKKGLYAKLWSHQSGGFIE